MTGRVVSHFATFHQGCQGMCYKTLWTKMKLWSVCLPGVHKPLGFAPGTAEGQETSRWTSGSSEAWSLPHHFSTLAFVFDPSGYFLQKRTVAVKNTFESVFRLWGSRQPSSCWFMMSYALKTWTESGSDRLSLWLIFLELKERGNQS